MNVEERRRIHRPGRQIDDEDFARLLRDEEPACIPGRSPNVIWKAEAACQSFRRDADRAVTIWRTKGEYPE